MNQHWMRAILCLLLMTAFFACAEENTVRIDEGGLATWTAIPDAVMYECKLFNADGEEELRMTSMEPFIYAPPTGSYYLYVRPIFENEECGEWLISDFYDVPEDVLEANEDAENYEDIEDDTVYVDYKYDLRWDDLIAFDLVSAIDRDTVKTLDGGEIYFEAMLPTGRALRFSGTGVEITPEGLLLKPDARLCALDSIGRLCAMELTQPQRSEAGDCVYLSGGYTFTDATEVESSDELYLIWGSVTNIADSLIMRYMDFQPNFIYFGADKSNSEALTLSKVMVYYDEMTFATPIRAMALNTEMYGTYMAGELYDSSRERYDSANGIFDFYLLIQPDVANEKEYLDINAASDELIMPRCLLDIPDTRFHIGDVYDAEGNVLDTATDGLTTGCTLAVTVGNYTMQVPLPVLERYAGAQTLKELQPYNTLEANGEVLALVVPIRWQDKMADATDEMLNTLRCKLGRIEEADGTLTDYTDESLGAFSLSAYYDTVSYGQHRITSYLTDWYSAPYNFEGEMEERSVTDMGFVMELQQWLEQTYPDMDWSRFDADGNGVMDAVILFNVGENSAGSVMVSTFSYANFVTYGNTGEMAGTHENPSIKNYLSINSLFLNDNTLIHEYAHGFGLVDYYDVTGTGIDAVGGFDMQSQNVGDWNAYSKYAAGWITPQVVCGLEKGESVEVTIGAFSETGDAIVLPAADAAFDGPFGEYLILDLFTDGGANRFDAAKYGLSDAVGVRISHVNATMEKRMLIGTDGVEYPFGSACRGNAYNEDGRYLLEVVQAGGENSFTDLDKPHTNLRADDLFKAGDVFTVEGYDAFFKDGRMDDGSALGYSVEILNIEADADGAYSAQIRITRQ